MLHKPCAEQLMFNPEFKTKDCKETNCIFFNMSQEQNDKLNKQIKEESDVKFDNCKALNIAR